MLPNPYLIPRAFEYFAPRSVREALSLLDRFREEAKVLAGGMSLIPVMKLRLLSPAYIVDINRIPRLEYVRESGEKLLIGAMTRHHSIEVSEVVRSKAFILAETAGWIGDPQVRNMGTIGGSLSHCDPSGDWGATMIALRGEVVIKGPSKKRIVAIDDFLLDSFTTALKPNELLTEIRIPIPPPRSGGAYMKLERKAGDFATVGVAVQVSLDREGMCVQAGIGLTALGPKNLRAGRAEKILVGRRLTARVIDEAADAAAGESRPASDALRGSAEYRTEMARIYAKRGLSIAVTRARQEGR